MLVGIVVSGGCAPRGSADAPDIVLITIDCLRIDALGTYGGPKGLTPVMDGLAAEGVVFERPWAAMATTQTSHATMMTGLYLRYHGVRWNGDVLRQDVQTLAELLEEFVARNRRARLVVHTIGIGEAAGSSFLRDLAARNRGQYVGFR